MLVDSMKSDRNMIDRNPSDNNLLDTLSNAFGVLKSPKLWLFMSIWSLILMIIYTFLWVDNIIELGVFLVGIFFLVRLFLYKFFFISEESPLLGDTDIDFDLELFSAFGNSIFDR